jgi:hypothetical protein
MNLIKKDMSVLCVYGSLFIGHPVCSELGGRRSNMYGLSFQHNRSSLCGGDIKLEEDHMGLVVIKWTCIGILVGAGTGHMSKSPTI